MRALAVSRTSKLSAAALALLLACTLGPAAVADELSANPAAGGVEADVADAEGAPMLASLMASGGGHISTAVALEDDPEPVVGSFTVGGLTYAIVSEGEVALVSVGSDVAALAAGPAGTDAGPLAGSDGAPFGEDPGSDAPPRGVEEQAPSGAASRFEKQQGLALRLLLPAKWLFPLRRSPMANLLERTDEPRRASTTVSPKKARCNESQILRDYES